MYLHFERLKNGFDWSNLSHVCVGASCTYSAFHSAPLTRLLLKKRSFEAT
jgi:hypothetical protein